MNAAIYERFRLEASRLRYQIVGEPAFGWNEKSVGSEVKSSSGEVFWAKMVSAPTDQAKGREWEGERFAAHWIHSWKPKLHHFHEFGENERVQFIVSDKISGCILGTHQHRLKKGLQISDRYLLEIMSALRSLSRISTERVNTRFDLVRRRVFERWRIDVEYADCSWETIHGDLHWLNLAGPKLEIIDWEGWGLGLQHQDIAFLMAFSCMDDGLVERMYRTFRAGVVDRNLALAQLFATSELLRMAENYGDHPDLVPGLKLLGERARDAWMG